MTQFDSLSYTAGIIDGEGCITIAKQHQKNCKNPHYRLMIRVGNTDMRMIAFLYEEFGGHIMCKHTPVKSGESWEWILYDKKAEAFLRIITNHIVCKRDEVSLVLAFRDTYNLGLKNRPTKEVQEIRELMYVQIKKMHKERGERSWKKVIPTESGTTQR